MSQLALYFAIPLVIGAIAGLVIHISEPTTKPFDKDKNSDE